MRRVATRCPNCRVRLKGVTPEMIGNTTACPRCKQDFTVEAETMAGFWRYVTREAFPMTSVAVIILVASVGFALFGLSGIIPLEKISTLMMVNAVLGNIPFLALFILVPLEVRRTRARRDAAVARSRPPEVGEAQLDGGTANASSGISGASSHSQGPSKVCESKEFWMSKVFTCQGCAFSGKAVKKYPGSGGLEMLLYIDGIIPILLTLIEPLPVYKFWMLALVGGVAYTIWRQSNAVWICPKCSKPV